MSVRLWPRSEVPPWRRGFPFFVAEPRSSLERLRAAASKQVWREGQIWKRLALGGAMAVGWPLVTFHDAVKISAKRAMEGRRPFLSSFGTLYRAALTRNMPPNLSALYEAALDVKATEMMDVLLQLDVHALQGLSTARGAVLEDVQNKARFKYICQAHGVECVETLAVFDHGRSTGENRLRTWAQPLFVKALTGNNGAGAALWYPSGHNFASTSGEELTVEDLINWLRPQNCIVQPALEDHPVLKAFGTVALSNVRIVTAKGRTIRSSPIAASITLAVEPGSTTGNNGFHCGIDLGDGVIVTTLAPVEEDTRLAKRDLIGLQLPDWSKCISLACKAHNEAFPLFAALGWDVALTSAGPVLLEANVNWGSFGHQRLTGPLGTTAISKVIDELLAPARARRSGEDHLSKLASRLPSPAPQEDRVLSDARGRKPRRRAAKAS